MAIILSIESSYKLCSVAVSMDGHVFLKEGEGTMNHAESLSRLIKDCMVEAGIQFTDLNAVAISDGPGSYTGLRIGASVAKGICYALDLPLIGIPTLMSLAAATARQCPDGISYVWPMIDARRMEVYHGVYDRQLRDVIPVCNGIVSEAGFKPDYIRDSVILCGDGAAKAADVLQLSDAGIMQSARHITPLAELAYEQKKFADPETYEPFYLKQANITGPLANH